MKIGLPRGASNAIVPSVTVVIPCYRYGKYLPAATAAALDQPGTDVRVIIVDDASPDDSAEIARALAEADPRVTLIAHSRNMGHIRTYNDGISAVETPYFSLVSADDLVAPGALTRAVRLMERHPSVGMVYGHPIEFEDGTDPAARRRRAIETWTVWKGLEWMRIAYWRGRCFILSPEVVMRTAVFHEIGGYNADLPHSGDLEYWVRTAGRWDIGRVNGPVQAYYRVHKSNMHLTTFAGMAQDLSHRAAAFDVLRRDPALARLQGVRRFSARAQRAMVRETLALARRELRLNGDREAAAALVDVAATIFPEAPAARRAIAATRASIRDSRPIPPPSRALLVREWLRRQFDRVRWRLYGAFGVS